MSAMIMLTARPSGYGRTARSRSVNNTTTANRAQNDAEKGFIIDLQLIFYLQK